MPRAWECPRGSESWLAARSRTRRKRPPREGRTSRIAPTADPNNKCFLPGVPRANYHAASLFRFFKPAKDVAILYEYVHAYRLIPLDGSKHPDDVDFWMGDSRGHWEGDTLVVDVSDNNDQTWFDASGNFHSGALHVVERYTRTGPDTIGYEATIEDPKVFTKPWKISLSFYRRRGEEFPAHGVRLLRVRGTKQMKTIVLRLDFIARGAGANARASGKAHREAGRKSRADAARR